MEGLGSCLPFEGGSFKGSFQASSKGPGRVPKYALDHDPINSHFKETRP